MHLNRFLLIGLTGLVLCPPFLPAADITAQLDTTDGSSAFVVADADEGALLSISSEGAIEAVGPLTSAGGFIGDGAGLTNLPETDPLWSAVSNAVIPGAAHGAEAHGWGDHAGAGYLTGYTETDPLWSAVSNDFVRKSGDTMTGALGINVGVDNVLVLTSDGDSIAIGRDSQSSGFATVALGADTIGGGGGIAIGWLANAAAFSSVAIGPRSVSSGQGVAIGFSSAGLGLGAAVGPQANGSGLGAAVGSDANGWDQGVAVGDQANGGIRGVAIGAKANGEQQGAALGYQANGTGGGVAVGPQANGSTNGVAIGYWANGITNGVAIGYMANGNDSGVAVGLFAQGERSGAAVGAQANALGGGAAVGHQANARISGVAVGIYSYAEEYGVAVGREAMAPFDGAAVGWRAYAHNSGAALGARANGADRSVAIGTFANGYTNGVAVGVAATAQDDGVAVGHASSGRSSGTAIGYASNGEISGAAVGREANADTHGSALGTLANGKTWGIAVGVAAYGGSRGIAIGTTANGMNLGNIAIGHGANAGAMHLGYRTAIGYAVTNDIANNTAVIRGRLYLDGAGHGVDDQIMFRPNFGTGEWTAKAFTIDHPLDPENKVLRHFTLEGPDVWNVYAGNAQLVNGRAVVDLPDYYGALNKAGSEIYGLTVIDDAPDRFARVKVARAVAGNAFEIAGDADVLVSWTVKALRNDPACIEDLRQRPVEQLKSELAPGQAAREAAAVNTMAVTLR